MDIETEMMRWPITRKAWIQAGKIFQGIALPMLVEIPDNPVIEGVDYEYAVNDKKRYLRTEKVIKFNRSVLRNGGNDKVEKVDPRYNGGDDTMIVKVGKPGDRERVEALRSQYEAIDAMGEEISPFAWER